MSIIIITLAVIFGILLIVFGIALASVQNSAINRCLDTKRLHNRLLVGDEKVSILTNDKLLSLKFPIYTHVGMGGVGPSYVPCFEIFQMVNKELSYRRRK